VGEFLDGDFLAAEGHLFAGGPRRCEQGQFGERKIPLFEAKEHFYADGTRRTNDRYMGMIHGKKPAVFRRGAEHTEIRRAGNRFVSGNRGPIRDGVARCDGVVTAMPETVSFSCALVTGASSGLGEEFAIQVAPRVGTLVLVARREPLLEQLADRIRAAFPRVAVAVFAVDLNRAAGRDELVATLAERGLLPDLLVNNAGLGDYGEFISSDWGKLQSMLGVNIEALTHLTHALVPEMIRRGGGAIINVSSLASVIPIPDFAVYAATKAYVTSFSEALRIELREHRISVLAVCPGPVRTEFGQVARRGGNSAEIPARKSFYVPKERVVAESLAAVERKAARVYPGLRTAAAALVLCALPMVVLRFALGFRPRRNH
jgi:short-subunit dehydrogenase